MMNITPIPQNSFKGYDARPLKGFLMGSNHRGIAAEMKTIGDREGFKIFGVRPTLSLKASCGELLPLNCTASFWAQDLWSIVNGKLLTNFIDNYAECIKNFFNLEDNFTQKIIRQCYQERSLEQDKKSHISGGNIFLIKGNDGDEVIVGENELQNFECTDIEGMYGTDKITFLPQMDYHLDLFIRPLDKKRILVTDDNLTLQELEKIHSRLRQNPAKYLDAIEKTGKMIVEFKNAIAKNKQAQTDKIVDILKNKGYKPIRVPGRIYNIGNFKNREMGYLPQHYCNYMNANVLINKKGKLVYITNKSNIDEMLGLTPEIIGETGCSFEKAFINSISDLVGKNHIYFISGTGGFVAKEMLSCLHGGIHCACTEVPEE